ncbi:MAG: NTP transferase domain-containing protein [Anaerolineaceae bacterium]|nr:NTP transferase domain-containing protein [Anaerolineaceae bacterium]
MKAVVLAGGKVDQDDLLFGKITADKKSMVSISGKPMVQWVVDALCDSKTVDQLYIIGLTESDGIESSKPVKYLMDQGGIFDNIRSGAQVIANDLGHDEVIFIVSGDIPGLKTDMVDWLSNQIEADKYDLYYTVAPRNVMEKTFPESKRSYIHLKDVEICGGDINLINTNLFQQESDLWKKLSESRKSPMRQAAMIGVLTLLLIFLRVITLERVAKRICRKLKIRGKTLVTPYAEMAMDIDKPHQLNQMETFLSGGAN